jgi:adenosylcobinamide kinase / adenosylcobinamide-phosphate guanylyltransferase
MGALSSGAPVVLAGATHDSARGGLRSLLLTSWGMIPAEDGDAWDTAEHTAGPASHLATAGPAVDLSAPLLPGRVLVIGGSASGKSQLAEDLLAAAPQVTYLATGPAVDPETDPDWAARVRRHRERRPASWQTAETTDPAAGLRQIPAPLLLDSLGSWLTGVLDRAQGWTQAPGWRDQVDAEMAALVQAYAQRPEPVVAVTDEVGWGVVPATAAGRLFRDLLGQLNQAVAGCSDQVVVVVAGQLMTSTGERP